jgi:hypothetical protein
LQKYIKICKLENNISIKNETISVMDYYRKSKIFLLTSVHEGFPLTVLEASADGCIPVCHDLSELKSFFKFQSEVLLYKSITKACHNISYLLDHPCKTKIISSYYHQLVFGHQKIYFQNTINLFEQFL